MHADAIIDPAGARSGAAGWKKRMDEAHG